MIKLERNSLVWGIVGNLGGGKTMTAVKIAVDAIRQGYFVVSNVQIRVDLIGDFASKLYQYVDFENADPFDFVAGDPRGSGGSRRVIVVLDEVAEFLDQFSATKAKTQKFMSWLRHSSKRSQDVVLVVQRQEYLAKAVRILVSRWVWVDDLAVYRLPVLKIKVPFCSDVVMQNTFDRYGNRIAPVDFIKKSVCGRYYDTAQTISAVSTSYTVYEVPPLPSSDVLFWVYVVSFLLLMGALL